MVVGCARGRRVQRNGCSSSTRRAGRVVAACPPPAAPPHLDQVVAQAAKAEHDLVLSVAVLAALRLARVRERVAPLVPHHRGGEGGGALERRQRLGRGGRAALGTAGTRSSSVLAREVAPRVLPGCSDGRGAGESGWWWSRAPAPALRMLRRCGLPCGTAPHPLPEARLDRCCWLPPQHAATLPLTPSASALAVWSRGRPSLASRPAPCRCMATGQAERPRMQRSVGAGGAGCRQARAGLPDHARAGPVLTLSQACV